MNAGNDSTEVNNGEHKQHTKNKILRFYDRYGCDEIDVGWGKQKHHVLPRQEQLTVSNNNNKTTVETDGYVTERYITYINKRSVTQREKLN